MALHTDTAIYKTTYDLAILVTLLVANMRRNYKASFGAKLHNLCLGLVMRVYAVNTAIDKREPLARMRTEVEEVNLSLRLAVDLRLISKPQYARAVALTDSIGKQATGWLQHSENTLVAKSSRR